jgi:hypothetical protein
MSSIKRLARGTTTWLNRAGLGDDLTTFTDRDLRDLGLVRHYTGINTCKLLWLAQAFASDVKLNRAGGVGHERASGKVSGSMGN